MGAATPDFSTSSLDSHVIHHVVLFRFASTASALAVEAAGAALLGLEGRVPEIRRMAFGVNLADSRSEYSHALLVELADMAAVQRYLDHPAHVEVVKKFVAPIREARLAIDFEVPA